MARVLIVGGGIAGMGVAHALVDKLGDRVEVSVVTKDTFYASGPSRPLLLSKEQSYDRIVRGYELAAAKGIRFVFGSVTRVDPDERVVEVVESPTRPITQHRLQYDYLVLAPGVVYDGSSITGFNENWYNVLNVYEMGKVDVLAQRIWSDDKGTVVVYAPKMPYRCAPAPSETTLAIDMVLRYRGVRGNFRIIHVDANPKPQPAVISDVLVSRFKEAGIELITSKEIVEIGPRYVVLNDGEKIEYTILAMLPPNRTPSFVTEAGLGNPWVEIRSPTDLRHPKYDDILSAGDAAKIPFPKNQEIAYESALYAANKLLEIMGAGVEPYSVRYAFVGWVYVGNLKGELKTESVQLTLDFTVKPPKGGKDPEPKAQYTEQKDRWEQSYLNKLFHAKPF